MHSSIHLSAVCLRVLTASVYVCGHSYNDTRQLTTDLFATYNPTIRPVIDQTKSIDVTALMLLGAIKLVNEKEQTISVNLYCWLWWQDELLTWTPSDYGNITAINPHITQVWTPTLNLAGSVTSSQILVDTSEIVPLYVNSSGEASRVTLQYAQENLDLRQYTVNSEWELVKTETSILTFDTGVSPPFYYISLSLIIKRRPRFFMLNLLMPTLALSFLNILVFILPADSGEKVGYSITVLLSVMLMMGVTTDTLPESSEVVPLITQFLTALTLISVLSVVVTVGILFVHHNQEEERKKKEKASSFIEKLKQKVALKSRIKPDDQRNDSRHDTQEIHSTEDPIETLVNAEDQLDPEHNLRTPGNGHLSANARQVSFVGAMQDAQSCIMMDPPQTNGGIRRPFGELFPPPKDAGSQPCKEKPGVGGIASLWFRGKHKQSEDKSHSDCSKQHKTTDSTCGKNTSTSEELWKELSRHLDTICFWIFLTAWSVVTLGYSIAMFS